MSSILVGMFETESDAEMARKRLLSAGFSSGALSIAGAATAASASPGTETQDEGGVGHFFRRLFSGDDDATGRDRQADTDTYNEAFRRGSYGLSVVTANDAEIDRAADLLNECGAVDIDSKSQQWKTEGWTGGAATQVSQANVPTGATRTLQEIDEELKVGKRTVSRGGVRIYSRMTEVPVEETVTLREEHADVQRRVVDRPATEADFAAFKEGSIEVRETAEEAVVSKSARVVAEVEIGKEVTQRQETVTDTVRQTRVDVERIDDASLPATPVSGASAMSASSGLSGVSGTPTAGHGTHPAGSANLDPITGEPGAHPVGTAVGATAGGALAGAAAGTVVGPVGTVVGAAVGAVAGGLAGKGVAEKVDPTVPSKR